MGIREIEGLGDIEEGSPGAVWGCERPGGPVRAGAMVTMARRFPARREEVKRARDYVGAALGEAHERRYDAMLVASELVGNAVQHGSRRSGPVTSGEAATEVEVSVTFVRRGVLLAVRDGGSPVIPQIRPLDGEDIGGRGLALVDLLARRWGFHRDSAGTLVWAELDERCDADEGAEE